MTDRAHILGLTRDELAGALAGLDLPAYRADQVRQWVFAKRVDDWARMTNLSKLDRAKLAERFVIARGTVVTRRQSADGVEKLLLAWVDGGADEATSEAVLIRATARGAERNTACVSTQAGCPVGCVFCASGLGGLQRNLTAGEIVEQAWRLATVLEVADGDRLSHVVFMGAGEPLANYDAVVRAVRLINAADGLNIGARRITVSTVGLPAQIRKLAGEDLQITLAISLHAPTQELRAKLIPWARRFPLDKVLDAARDYFARTGREITFEYCLLEGINSDVSQADALADIAHSVRCNVNLIACNPVAELGVARPAAATVRAFRERLARRGVNAHVRASRGQDIDAACGQLRRRRQQGG